MTTSRAGVSPGGLAKRGEKLRMTTSRAGDIPGGLAKRGEKLR
jgi:hypothetical protein